MSFACHAPAGPLGEHVVDIWTCALPVGAVGPVERVLPSGTVELVINLRHDDVRVAARGEPARPGRYAGPVVSGTYAEPFVIDPRWHTEMLGVHFRPGGASRVLGVPAAELRGAHVELAALWGAAAAADLHERACAAREPGQRLAAVARVLHDRLARSRARHTPVPAALRLFGPSGTAAPGRCVLWR